MSECISLIWTQHSKDPMAQTSHTYISQDQRSGKVWVQMLSEYAIAGVCEQLATG